MTKFKAIAAAVIIMAWGSSATAGVIESYDVSAATPGNPDHVLWIPGIATSLLFDPVGSFVIDDGGDGDPSNDFGWFTGVVYVGGNSANGGFNVDITFSGISRPGDLGHNVFADNAKFECCSADSTVALAWTFFENVTGTLEGINAFAGEDFDVSRRGPAVQMGQDGANGKNSNLGLSTWLNFDAAAGNRELLGRYTGDINVDLVAVPEPGTLALLGLGLVGMGFLRRRQRA